MNNENTQKTVDDLSEDQNKAIEALLMEKFEACSPELRLAIVAVGNKFLLRTGFIQHPKLGAEFDKYMSEMNTIVGEELKK